jgi:hypothetical protein
MVGEERGLRKEIGGEQNWWLDQMIVGAGMMKAKM